MRLTIAIALLALLGSFPSAARAQARVLELGHEAEPAMIRMPDRAAGELTLQICPTCQVLRLRASNETVYLIDRQPVTLRDMTVFLQRNPGANVVVMQIRGSATLSRVVASTAPAKR